MYVATSAHLFKTEICTSVLCRSCPWLELPSLGLYRCSMGFQSGFWLGHSIRIVPMLWVVMLKGEPTSQSEVVCTVEQVSFQDLCIWMHLPFPQFGPVFLSLLLRSTPIASCYHFYASPEVTPPCCPQVRRKRSLSALLYVHFVYKISVKKKKNIRANYGVQESKKT